MMIRTALLMAIIAACTNSPAWSAEVDSGTARATREAVVARDAETGMVNHQVFFDDPTIREIVNSGWTERKQILLECRTSVGGKNDPATQARVKGRTAMVFHLLREMLGADAYSRSVAKLTSQDAPGTRSWTDIRTVFEKESAQDLGQFFTQWTTGKELPELRVENAAVRRSGSRFEISFDLIQKGATIYTLDVPLAISFFQGDARTEHVKLDTEKKQVSLIVENEPASFVVDGNYDLPRMLSDDETPPLLGRLLDAEQAIVVLPVSNKDLYGDIRETMKKQGAEEREPDSMKDADIAKSSLLLLGEDNPVARRLFAKTASGNAQAEVRAEKNPLARNRVIVMFQARTKEAAAVAAQELSMRATVSAIAIDAHITATTAASDRGIVMNLRQETIAVDLSLLTTLDKVIDSTSDKKIVYVGEYHDRFAHHNVQLQVIKRQFQKDRNIAIGMEMFQRPFQETLDKYIGGALDEREFLRKSEYFKRWGFDYNLYKPILDFARAQKIPVVALNLRREITEKVSKSGMDALTVEEKKDIPREMDLSDDEYRTRLKQVFDQHKSPADRSFEFFYQAQVLWDETMAESLDTYLQQNPDRRMVVIAGGGHLAFESGIPKRAFRRNGYSYATILNDADIEPGAADYILLPPPLDGIVAPRLMVALKESGEHVSILGFPEGSIAEQAGLKQGDAIVSVDNTAIKSVEDLKLLLFYKQKNDTLRVKIKRKRFLLGDKEMEFLVTL